MGREMVGVGVGGISREGGGISREGGGKDQGERKVMGWDGWWVLDGRCLRLSLIILGWILLPYVAGVENINGRLIIS